MTETEVASPRVPTLESLEALWNDPEVTRDVFRPSMVNNPGTGDFYELTRDGIKRATDELCARAAESGNG